MLIMASLCMQGEKMLAWKIKEFPVLYDKKEWKAS